MLLKSFAIRNLVLFSLLMSGFVVLPVQSQQSSGNGAAARLAQEEFEKNRRAGLRFYNGGANASCEVQIGTLCYWNNNGDISPPAERTDLIIERDRLLEVLAAAAAADPTDEWVAGMRVRYAIEQKRNDLAVTAAMACRGGEWWCEALKGLSHHVSNNHVASSEAFDLSLSKMPDSLRCAWTDLSPWLPESFHIIYNSLDCNARSSRDLAFLKLAQPLWMLPANDLRNELLARHTISRIHGQGRIPYDLPFDGSISTMQVRYGWPVAWSMQTAGALDPRMPSIIGHEPVPSYDFIPAESVLSNPLTAKPSDWLPDRRDARMRYSTRYASGYAELPHQFARFLRSDSTLLVGAWRLMREQRMGPAPYTAGLVVLDSSMIEKGRSVRDSVSANGAAAVTMGKTPSVASLEVFAHRQARATRARTAIRALPSQAGLSDMLLLAGGDIGPAPDVENILGMAWGSTDIEPGRTFGLYWESYLPVSEANPTDVTIKATRTSSSFAQRIGNALRLSQAMTPVSVSFRDPGRPDGKPGRAVQFTWPDVPPGEYRLTITVASTSGMVDSTSQLVTVRDKP